MGGRNLQWPIKVTNTLWHGCYRHYSVSFYGRGMTVQCCLTVQFNVVPHLMTVYTWLMAWWYILDPNCTKLGVTQVWDLNFFFMSNSMNEILHETNPLFFNFGLFFFWQSYECLFPENCIKTFQISFYWCHLTLDYR